ncbi:MAG TPA: amidohydrolase family protein [Steroidobacteraceae bacterium]
MNPEIISLADHALGILCRDPLRFAALAAPAARDAAKIERRTILKGALGFMVAGAPTAWAGATDSALPAAPARRFRIDIHHHIAPPAYVEDMKSLLFGPTLGWSPEKSIEDMDRAGVATAITSITTPGIWLGDDKQGRRVARECNDYGAKMSADFPGRFGMFAALPLPDTEGSLHEIEYGLDTLKADGIALFTSYRDKWLGDPQFDPVMEELNRRKALVYAHPDAPLCCRNLLRDLFNNSVIEYTADTTRAIANLLFKGAVSRYRDIRWIFSHGGGTVPFVAERLIRIPETYRKLAATVPNGVMAELTRFHYDLAQASHPGALAALTKLFPVSQLLWGTDFPFRRGEEYVQQHLAYGFSESDLREIGRDNALQLLPRWRATV